MSQRGRSLIYAAVALIYGLGMILTIVGAVYLSFNNDCPPEDMVCPSQYTLGIVLTTIGVPIVVISLMSICLYTMLIYLCDCCSDVVDAMPS